MTVVKKIQNIQSWLELAYSKDAEIVLLLQKSAINKEIENKQIQINISELNTGLLKKSVWTSKLSFFPWNEHCRSIHIFTSMPLPQTAPKPNIKTQFGKFTLYGWLTESPLTLSQWQAITLGMYDIFTDNKKWVSEKTYTPLPGSPNWFKKPASINEIEFIHQKQYPLSTFNKRIIEQNKRTNIKVKPQDYQEANERLNILNLYESYQEVFKLGANYFSRFCYGCGEGGTDSNKVSIDPNKNLFHCFKCDQAGSTLDLLVLAGKYKNKAEAAIDILNLTDEERTHEYQPIAYTPKEKVIELPNPIKTALLTDIFNLSRKLKAPDYQKCLDYLTGRNISLNSIREAFSQNLISFLPDDPKKANQLLLSLGRERLVEAGMLKSESTTNFSSFAFRPILTLYGTNKIIESCEFRIISKPKKGDVKSRRFNTGQIPAWHWKGKNPSKIAIVEGMPDSLSLPSLNWDGDIMCIPGLRNWQSHWAKLCKGKHVTIIFDNALINQDTDNINSNKSNADVADAMLNIEDDVLPIALSFAVKIPKFANDINEILTKN